MNRDFDKFKSTVAFNYITLPWYQDEVNASAIQWHQLPQNDWAVECVVKYQALRRTMSHELACHEMQGALPILERMAGNLSDIPKGHALSEKFQELYEIHQHIELAKQIEKNPNDAKNLVVNFKTRQASSVESYDFKDVSNLIISELAEDAKQDKSVIKIPRFEKLSEMIGGFNPKRIGILTGTTGLGKTNFAINLSLAAESVMNVGYINMEMALKDIFKRYAVISNRISYSDFNRGKYDVKKVIQDLSSKRIQITSGKPLSCSQIAAWVKLQSSKNPIKLLIVDYDQKIELKLARGEDEWRGIQRVMTELEALSHEHDLYCLVLAQVNRQNEISGSFRSQFPAHSVLNFTKHETHGHIIHAIKNRHGRKDQSLKIHYDEQCSAIDEIDVVTIDQQSVKKQNPSRLKQVSGQSWQDKY